MTQEWLTSSRKAHLFRIFSGYASILNGFKVDEETGKVSNPSYERVTSLMIADWKADDREAKEYEWLLERKAMHSLGEKRSPLRGRFSNISSEIWHNQQPQYYVERLGYSTLSY